MDMVKFYATKTRNAMFKTTISHYSPVVPKKKTHVFGLETSLALGFNPNT